MPATPIKIIGTLGGDPELRDAGGSQVASFSVAVTERKRDGDTWVDGATSWFRCNAWRDLGQNIAATLHKGDRIFVDGTIGERKWTDREGNEKTSWEVTAEDAGPSLRFATATVVRAGSRGGRVPSGDTDRGRPVTAQAAPRQQAAWAGSYDDNTPF
ncbi:hypothetical protein Q3G72_031876 [Acer saccharum]|nr:hypothetical protein Q3G72_031876 [Acer saccharum]